MNPTAHTEWALMHITRQTSRSPHHEPPLKVRRGRREKKHLLKVRKNRDSNQGLGPEAEPLPTMLQEAWSPKITNHYDFKPLGIRPVQERQAPARRSSLPSGVKGTGSEEGHRASWRGPGRTYTCTPHPSPLRPCFPSSVPQLLPPQNGAQNPTPLVLGRPALEPPKYWAPSRCFVN